MSIQYRSMALGLAALLLAGCAAHHRGEAATDGGVTSQSGATVISGAALTDGHGSLLSTLQGKVPSMRILRHEGECPQITLRNAVAFQSVVNPHVYVDGTRTTDTCILESLRSVDVALVEVYPMGFTRRPGYGPHAHGLILVFMRGG